MTSIYFVRHAQPNHAWENDRTRPLSEEGILDSKEVVKTLSDIRLDYAICSPYLRSMDTIKECAKVQGLVIQTDERLREREKGPGGNTLVLIEKRWSDFDYHEDGGESLKMTQGRNVQALTEVLKEHPGENILWGTHGTALSTILHYFEPSYNFQCFMRIIDFMPYVIRLDFEGLKLVGKEELLIVEKEYKGK